ncbi:MAG: hypothetical protein HY542_06605 [Deltaproteobacteria bacterium]|nr:hypothetical protein [Deltaproteobacteria bacterium]
MQPASTEGETVYQRCHWRRPEKVESEREFREILEYRSGPLAACGPGHPVGQGSGLLLSNCTIAGKEY